jgi:DNA/RNA-binding domain of Phe-tRNA-synthetase-like protein
MIRVSENFRSAFPRARPGFLAMTGVTNPPTHPQLEARKSEVEQELRRRYGSFDRAQLKQLPAIQAYDAHYCKFDKSYHVLAQVESVAVKGKPIPSVAALVEAMFMAELGNMLLTAGHDLFSLEEPLTLGVAAGGETYLGIRGRQEICQSGDMTIADKEGIVSSVLFGPDARTRITPLTTSVLFAVYVPEGLSEEVVGAHLRDIETYVRLVSPEAKTRALEVL